MKPTKRCSGGIIKTTGPRVAEINLVEGPGPRYKLHEKVGSMWRASHLGTYNVYLKGLDTQYPNSGGYHPRGPLDQLGDEVSNICRPDEYQHLLCPTSFEEVHLRKKKHKRRRGRNY